MKIRYTHISYTFSVIILVTLMLCVGCENQGSKKSESILNESDEANAKPWIFWYWMHGAVSREAITADLEAMHEVGIGGAMLMPIKEVLDSSFYYPSYGTMTPEWWDLVQYAMEEAKRLGLQIGMNACDGFTCAGGPWITPEMSMQKVVWADTLVTGGHTFKGNLPQPEIVKGYYDDIATFAYPALAGTGISSYDLNPKVTTSLKHENLQYLAQKHNTRQFSTRQPCWIQYAFEKPFTCRSVMLKTGWNNYQANRLIIEISDDGVHFTKHTRLVPPRSGWLDLDADNTQSIPPVTAKYFRFVFDPEGSEPGAEDIDDAKWSPRLRTSGIELSGDPRISQFEGKSGMIWRIAKETTDKEISSDMCVPEDQLINISEQVGDKGELEWDIPEGKWIILRIGHTSTGHENYVGGGGKGLECDKFDPEVIRFQFDQWFGEAFRQVGPGLAGDVLKRFHIDSWECGSQNWSHVFPEEFKKRRGYDLMPYLPVMAGVPLKDTEFSEKVLKDIRTTVSDLFTDVFYRTLAEEAHKKKTLFSAECIAPVGVSDGMLHYKEVDLPMGEFWYNSPSHDKPNDMLDAISASHIYGKRIIQAEALTEIRLDWDEYPGILKPVVDRNFALGANRMVPHVFVLNPWMDRKPGMTLGMNGNFFQRDQTWWKPGKAFFEYLTNCQRLLQKGDPVVDIAVFTGEEIPRRAILPDRLVDVLPGIFGRDKVELERKRLENAGIPTRDIPKGVRTQSNMADPDNWIDPLNGYAYDSFNKDALLRLATVEDGRIVLPGGASYGVLVIPGNRKMAPDGGKEMSLEVAEKLLSLVKDGAIVLMMDKPDKTPGWQSGPNADQQLKKTIAEFFNGDKVSIEDGKGHKQMMWNIGKGKVIQGPWILDSFDPIHIQQDVQGFDTEGEKTDIAWNHRTEKGKEIYFISNQQNEARNITLSFRVDDKEPVLYDPVRNTQYRLPDWQQHNARTELKYRFEPYQSVFVVFEDNDPEYLKSAGKNWLETKPVQRITGPWNVKFDPEFGGPEEAVRFNKLTDWSKNADTKIKYYSGTAVYSTSFEFSDELKENQSVWLDLGEIANIAEVTLNGKSCGIAWTAPYRLRIDGALKSGNNELQIAVTNTWANRLIGDHQLPEDQRITWTTAPYRLEGKPLGKAGLLGPVSINYELRNRNGN
ncbi:glycosyl hydrolase [Saccharicrinis sp. FJH2]|uniref:glycosyl hydrolase n=1 Tax=Saccharicrinis sp. FJH65 TaxID=3344659 RepID=UPI0035F3B0CB